MQKILLALLLILGPVTALAQSVEVDDSGASSNSTPSREGDSGKSGKGSGSSEASKYFQFRKGNKPVEKDTATDKGAKVSSAAAHYLAVHVGTFFTDQAYGWGTSDQKNVGQFNAGVTYRIGEWTNVADLALRVEYTSFSLDNGGAKKVSVSPLLTFPDSRSRFPLYIGAGVGPGLFLQQTHGVSPVSIDYQIVGGIRFLDLIEKVGFMLETGLKNHVLLLSDGQFNGVFINVGAVFAF